MGSSVLPARFAHSCTSKFTGSTGSPPASNSAMMRASSSGTPRHGAPSPRVVALAGQTSNLGDQLTDVGWCVGQEVDERVEARVGWIYWCALEVQRQVELVIIVGVVPGEGDEGVTTEPALGCEPSLPG